MRNFLKRLLLVLMAASVMTLSLGGCVVYGGHGWDRDWNGGPGYHWGGGGHR
jgi:hypothetical protein